MDWSMEGSLALVAIGMVSLFSQWLAWRLHQPAILWLLLAGMALGPLTQVVDPSKIFGFLTPWLYYLLL